MADSSLIGSAAIDINKIKSKLGEISQQNIKLSINSQDILGKIGNVKSELDALTKSPYEITVNLAGTAETQIQNLQNQLDNINKQSAKQARNQQRTNRKSGGSSKKLEQSTGFPVSRRKWAQKYRDAANAEEQRVIQSLLGEDATLISASGRQRFDKTGKEIGSDWIVTYRNELGKTVKTMLQSTRALDENGKRADKWRVAGTAINANYEAQAKYVKDIAKEYEKMEESAFSKGGLDKNSPFGVAATDALKDYKSELDKIISTKDYSDDSRKKLEQLKSQTQKTINQQKELRDAQKASEQSYLSDLKKNSKQLEFEQKTSTNAQNLITNAQNELKLLEKSTFSGSKALTGDYASKAREEIEKVSGEFEKLKEAAGKSFSDAINVSKDGLTASLKNLGAELDRLKGLEYPADKLAAKDVDTLKLDYGNKIQEFRNQLKEAGLESSEFTTKLDALGKSLQTVGAVDGSGAVWANWKAQFESLQASYEKFQASASGKGLKLAESIGSGQLEQIQSLVNTLNNLPSDLSGAGVENLKQELSTIATEYNNLISQLQSGNLTSDQFAELSNKAKELDDRLKQASNSARMFQDGFKNEQSLHKFQSNIEGLRNNFEKLERTYANIIEKNPEIAAKFEQLRTTFEQGQVDPINYAQVASDVTNLGRACSNAAGEASGLRGALEGAFGGVGQYLARFTSAFYIINKGIQTVKSMVNEVKSLDTSLMELQKVTTLSGDSLAQFTDNAYKTGKEVGRTGKDVIDAVTTFSRAGYNLEESNQLAKAALTMTNVGVDIPNTEAAASDMISILKAFDKQADESMQVIDKLYNVANKEPLDFGNITEMLVTAGGTLAQTNTSLEQSMGLLTGGFATLRSPSVANGLIQISQRLRGVKEDGEAIEEEGFMPKLKKAFGDAGVAIEDQNGELRSTYDILHDLAGQWDTLSSKQRQYLGEKAAGTRQVKVLNAIMANWDVVEDTIQKANEATGEATKGNEKYLDSIEGRITQFKSAFSDLARTTIDSDLVKGIVSIGTGILNVTKNAGGLVPVLTTIVGIVTILKGAKIAEGLTTIATAIKGLFTGISSLSAGAGAVGAIIAIVGVIAAVASGIKNAQKSISETAASARKNYSDQQSKVESLNGELQHTQELMSDLEGKELSIVEQDEYDRLKQTNDELQRQIALEQARLKITQREAREATARELKQYNENIGEGGFFSRPSYNEVSEGLFSTLGKEWFDKNLNKEHILYGEGTTNAEILKNLPASYVPSTEELVKAHSDALLQEKKNLLEANEKYYSELAKYSDENGDFTGDEETLKYIESLEQAKDTAQNYVNESETFLNDYLTYLEEKTAGISKVENAAPGSLDEYYNSMIEQREQLADLLLTSSIMDMSKGKQADLILAKYTEAAKAIQELVKESGQITAEDLGSDAFKEIISEFEKYGWSVDEAATHLTQFYKEQDNKPDFISNYDELIKNNYLATESYKALTEAMAEQEKAGTISAETFKKITADKELANYLQNTEGALRITANGLELNTEAMQDYIEIQNGKDRIEALALMQKDIALLEEAQTAMQGLTDENERAQKLDEVDSLQNEITALQAYVSQLDNATSALERYQNAKKTSNQDAAFNVGQNVYKDIKEGRKTGKTGTDDFKDAVGFILGPNWEEDLEKRFPKGVEQAYSEAEKLSKRYFGQKDERTGMTNFMKDLSNAEVEEGRKLAEFNAKTGEFQLGVKANGESYSLEEIGNALGIYSEAVSSLFGLMETYDYDVEYEPFVSPEDQKAIDEYNAKVAEQEQAVKNLSDTRDEADKELKEAEKTYNESMTEENRKAYEAAQKKAEDATKAVEQAQDQLDALQSGTAKPVETMSVQDALNLYNQFKSFSEQGIPVQFIPQYEEVTAYLESLGVIEPKNVDIEATDKTEDGVRDAEENVNSVKQDKPIDLEGNADGVIEAANVANNAIEGIEKNPDATKLNADPTGVEEGVNAAEQAISNIDNPDPITLSARLDGTFSAIKATISGWVESIKGLIKGIGEEWEKSNKEAEDYWAQQRKWRQELNPPPDESGKPEPKQEPPEQPITSNGNNGIPSQEEVSVGAKLEEGSGNQLKNDLQQEMDDSGPIETEVQATTEPTPAPSSTPAPSTTPAPVETQVEASPDAGNTIREQTQEQLDSQPPVKEQVVQEQQPTQTPATPNETKFELDLGNVDSVQDQVGQIANMSDELAGMASEAGASAGSINALNDACAELITATSDLGSIDMGDPASVEAASSSISTAASNFNDAYNKLSAEINTMQTVNVGANTSSAEASIDALSNKTITVTVVTNEVPGNAKGTRSADPGLSLVDEKGAELIEHTRRGTYELGTNNGPRLTSLEAGDVVHTASETKRILSRMSKIGGFFRDGLNQAKSVLTGGAFGTGVAYDRNPYNKRNDRRVSASGKNATAMKSSSKNKSSSKKSSKKKSSGGSKTNMKKLQAWFEKLFDWAEIRLERLQTITNEWIYNAGQAIGYAAQNTQLANAMASVENQIRDTTAAYNLYIAQADKVAKKTKLSADIINRIQNGTIEISSYDKKTQQKIQFYKEWLNFSCHFE